MSRKLRVGAAQIGPVLREESREHIVDRHIALIEEAARRKVELVVYPECSLTTWFPRFLINDSQLDKFFEKSMPNPSVQPLFDRAKELGVGFVLGYGERDGDKQFNSSILVGKDGAIIGKYRKSHIGGTYEPILGRKFQYMERRYFLPGDTGFKIWPAFGGYMGMGICYDRRWPEFWRVMGMQGAELVAIGFCSGGRSGGSHLGVFHHQLCLQAGAYWSGMWVVASAHCGEEEEGYTLMGHSAIVSPSGEIIAESYTIEDELIDTTIDLDETIRRPNFSPRVHRDNAIFVRDRRPEFYKAIADPEWDGVPT